MVPTGRVANHAGTVISIWGKLYIAQAMGYGIEVVPFEKEYGWRLDRIKVISPKKPYSKDEQDKISKVAAQSASDNVKYDKFGLFYSLLYILSGGKWFGPIGEKASKKLYCTEAVATWANKVRPKTFDSQESVNPLDIELNKYYKVIYDGSNIE